MKIAGRIRLFLVLVAITLIPIGLWFAMSAGGLVKAPGAAAIGGFDLSDRLVALDIQTDGGTPVVLLEGGGTMEAEAFLQEIAERQAARSEGGRHWLYAVLDVTSWTGFLWVGLGLLGQVLFAGRMLVQWLASERAKQSVVPNSFWWLSLLGASMLLAYFIWRVDVVGVLGQITGWFVYVRNLWFIYGGGSQ